MRAEFSTLLGQAVRIGGRRVITAALREVSDSTQALEHIAKELAKRDEVKWGKLKRAEKAEYREAASAALRAVIHLFETDGLAP